VGQESLGTGLPRLLVEATDLDDEDPSVGLCQQSRPTWRTAKVSGVGRDDLVDRTALGPLLTEQRSDVPRPGLAQRSAQLKVVAAASLVHSPKR
jgi:hypothetical protein